MDVLILGGTQWVGRELARGALARGHRVTCLARGESGAVADGAELAVADRDATDAYAAVAGRAWDAVIDVTRTPGHARAAAEALAGRAAHWTFVSSGNVYARQDEPGADETAGLLPPQASDEATPALYGEAKSAIERTYRDALGDRLLVLRPGLIGGPGDASGRTGYWVARAARDADPILVPDIADDAVQIIDVRDLVGWTLDLVEARRAGAFNVVGDRLTFAGFVDASRRIAGHKSGVVVADPAWLRERGIVEWSGPESIPNWIAEPGWHAFQDRSNRAAIAAGLRIRPLDETLADLLEWERGLGLDRERRAGLSRERERELRAELQR